MNSVATLLHRLSTRPLSEPSPNDARRSGTEDALKGDKGQSGSFDAVLSGLSQNSSGEPKAEGAATPRAPHIASMTGEAPTVTTVVKTATSSSSLTDSEAAVSVPATASAAELSYTEATNAPVRGSTAGSTSPVPLSESSDSGTAAMTNAEASVSAALNRGVDPASGGPNQAVPAGAAPAVSATNAPAQNMPFAVESVATAEPMSTNASQLGIQNSASQGGRTAGASASLPRRSEHIEKSEDESTVAATLGPTGDEVRAGNAGSNQLAAPTATPRAPTSANADDASGSTALSPDEMVPHHIVHAGDPQGRAAKAEVRHADQVDKPAEPRGGSAIVDITASAALAGVVPSVLSDTVDAEPAAADVTVRSGVDASIRPASAQSGERSARMSASAAGRLHRDGRTGDVQAPVTLSAATATPLASENADNPVRTEVTSQDLAPSQIVPSAVGTSAVFAPSTSVAAPVASGNVDNPVRTEATSPDLAASQIVPSAAEVPGTGATPGSHIEAQHRRSAQSGEHAAGTSAVVVPPTAVAAPVASGNVAITELMAFLGSAAVATVNTTSLPPDTVSASVDGSHAEDTARVLRMPVERQESGARALASTPPSMAGLDATQASSASSADPDGSGPSAAMRVTAVSSATHFAPVSRLSPVQQISDAAIGALSSLSAVSLQAPAAVDAAGATPGAASQPSVIAQAQPAAPAMQMLNLQLEPNSLGVVTITLNLSANGLEVQVAANHPATMDLIERDKQALTDQLRQSGYSVAGVAVSHGGSNVANGGAASQNQGSQNAASGGNQTMSHGGSPNGNSSPQSGAQNGLESSANRQETFGSSAGGTAGSAARGSVSGDLYI